MNPIRPGILASCLLAAGLASALPPALTDDEMTDAERYFQDIGFGRPLHTLTPDRDGVKTDVFLTAAPRLVLLDERLESTEDVWRHRLYCGSTAIVSAVAGDAVSRLSTKKDTILTRRTFTVSGAVKPAASIDPGSVLSVIYRGGEVVDEGETLRAVDEAQDPIVPGGHYLLALVRGSLENEFYPETAVPVVPLRDDQLDPSTGIWEGFRAGASVGKIQSAMLATIRLSPCR